MQSDNLAVLFFPFIYYALQKNHIIDYSERKERREEGQGRAEQEKGKERGKEKGKMSPDLLPFNLETMKSN